MDGLLYKTGQLLDASSLAGTWQVLIEPLASEECPTEISGSLWGSVIIATNQIRGLMKETHRQCRASICREKCVLKLTGSDQAAIESYVFLKLVVLMIARL